MATDGLCGAYLVNIDTVKTKRYLDLRTIEGLYTEWLANIKSSRRNYVSIEYSRMSFEKETRVGLNEEKSCT